MNVLKSVLLVSCVLMMVSVPVSGQTAGEMNVETSELPGEWNQTYDRNVIGNETQTVSDDSLLDYSQEAVTIGISLGGLDTTTNYSSVGTTETTYQPGEIQWIQRDPGINTSGGVVSVDSVSGDGETATFTHNFSEPHTLHVEGNGPWTVESGRGNVSVNLTSTESEISEISIREYNSSLSSARGWEQEDSGIAVSIMEFPEENVSDVYGEINFPDNTSSSDLGESGQVWTSEDYDNTSIAVFETGDFLVGVFVQDDEMSDSERETTTEDLGALVVGGGGSEFEFEGPDVPFWLVWGPGLLAGLIVVYLILDSRDMISRDWFV